MCCRRWCKLAVPLLGPFLWTQQRTACTFFRAVSLLQVRRRPLRSASSYAAYTNEDAVKFAALADIAPIDPDQVTPVAACICRKILEAAIVFDVCSNIEGQG